MTVLKLTKTKKGVLVIDDDGRVYVTSVNSILYLLKGLAKGDFITTKRLPIDCHENRFAKSELYDPNGVWAGKSIQTVEKKKDDALAQRYKMDKEEKKIKTDRKVW